MKQNAVPASCCKISGPGCGDDLDMKDPFENIFVQGCTQLLYFSTTRMYDYYGVGMAMLFLNWCLLVTCIILACTVTYSSGISRDQFFAGEKPEKKEEKSDNNASNKHGSVDKRAKTSVKRTGDELDFAEENKAPNGARNLLIDKSDEQIHVENLNLRDDL